MGKDALLELHVPLSSVAPDGDEELIGQGVGDGDAHAMESAGECVSAGGVGFVELSPAVEATEDDFCGGALFNGMRSDGDAAAVVFNGDVSR